MEEFIRPQLKDQRSHSEIDLTNLLARTLGDINVKRFEKPYQQLERDRKSHRKEYLYICLSGFNHFSDQFENLGISGQKIVVHPTAFDPSLSSAELMEKIEDARIQKQAEKLHNILRNRLDKPLVFIFHSFSTYVVSTLLTFFPTQYKGRIKGLVAIGPHPITATPGLKKDIEFIERISHRNLMGNPQKIFEEYKRFVEGIGLKSMYSTVESLQAGFIAVGHGIGAAEGLRLNKHWPRDILKCFIWGREDVIMDEANINEMAIYYCHKRPLQQDVNQKVADILRKRGIDTAHSQERFIFNLDGGKHSVHIQKKIKPIVKKIIDEYLSVLEELQ